MVLFNEPTLFGFIANYPSKNKNWEWQVELVKMRQLGKSCRFQMASVGVIASDKDVILCKSMSSDVDDQRIYYACNPRTWQWVALPAFPSKHATTKSVLVGLVVSDDEEHNFRVVRIPQDQSSINSLTSLEIEILASETKQWREHSLLLSRPINLASFQGFPPQLVFGWDGTLHWFANENTLITILTTRNNIT